MAIFGLGDDKTNEDEVPNTNEAGESTETGGDPIISDESSNVIVEDDDGEIDAPRYCKGTFSMMKATEFTQNENYSDYYLKTKGLFVETEDEE